MRNHPIFDETFQAGIRLGIDRFHSFISYIGNPLVRYPIIHVAGTNGKGSVVRMLESCLHQAGYRVGSYTSPHLQNYNERIRVGAEDITDERLEALLTDLYQKAKEWLRKEYHLHDDIPLTTFELLTAVAFQYFWDEKVDVAIVEVGLGGRYDATNIVTPILSIISSISLDHTELLGVDEASIAAEKAGIIKENIPVIAGNLSLEALRTIRTIAQQRSSAFYSIGSEIRHSGDENGLHISFLDKQHRDCPVPLLGSHQYDNTALVVSAVQLISTYFPMSAEERNLGLLSVDYRGRLEWLEDNILVDCAHNEAGARQLSSYLMTLPHDTSRNLVIGLSREKDLRGIILSLSQQVDRIYVIAANHYRALSVDEMYTSLQKLRLKVDKVHSFAEMHEKINTQQELLILSGSIFLVGAYMDWRDDNGYSITEHPK